jgi:hypothetical protein
VDIVDAMDAVSVRYRQEHACASAGMAPGTTCTEHAPASS